MLLNLSSLRKHEIYADKNTYLLLPQLASLNMNWSRHHMYWDNESENVFHSQPQHRLVMFRIPNSVDMSTMSHTGGQHKTCAKRRMTIMLLNMRLTSDNDKPTIAAA